MMETIFLIVWYMMAFVIILGLSIVIVLAACWIWAIFIQSKLFYSDNNPYRRLCKKCNSQQEWMHWNHQDSENGWWEETGEGNNSECVCKKWQQYKSPYANS